MNGIVVMGGEEREAMGTLEFYNPVKDAWSALPVMPAKLQYDGSAVMDRGLYVTGG